MWDIHTQIYMNFLISSNSLPSRKREWSTYPRHPFPTECFFNFSKTSSKSKVRKSWLNANSFIKIWRVFEYFKCNTQIKFIHFIKLMNFCTHNASLRSAPNAISIHFLSVFIVTLQLHPKEGLLSRCGQVDSVRMIFPWSEISTLKYIWTFSYRQIVCHRGKENDQRILGIVFRQCASSIFLKQLET